jgi:hypothetical protein
MSDHHTNLDDLLEQFKANCHRTLTEYLKDPHPQMGNRVVISANSWLAKFVIAYEGEQWSKSAVPGINLDYARFVGWMNNEMNRLEGL